MASGSISVASVPMPSSKNKTARRLSARSPAQRSSAHRHRRSANLENLRSSASPLDRPSVCFQNYRLIKPLEESRTLLRHFVVEGVFSARAAPCAQPGASTLNRGPIKTRSAQSRQRHDRNAFSEIQIEISSSSYHKSCSSRSRSSLASLRLQLPPKGFGNW